LRRIKGGVSRGVALLLLPLAACGFQPAQQRGSSVTVTLPPPKPAPEPGFSPISDPLP
jgi:hypothetical protein